MYHIFFIHSSVDGHLDCFYILGIVSSAAMNIGVLYLFKLVFLFSSDIYPRVELLDHMVVLFLVFWGTFVLFSVVTTPIYIPTNSVGGFPFLHILANICYLWSLRWEPFWQMWGDISLWFWFAFLWCLVMLNIFSCVCWPSECLLWENFYSDFLTGF